LNNEEFFKSKDVLFLLKILILQIVLTKNFQEQKNGKELLNLLNPQKETYK